MARDGVAVAVVWGLLVAAQAEVYDVTTIYRYDRPGAEPLTFTDISDFDAQIFLRCQGSTSCQQNRKQHSLFDSDHEVPDLSVEDFYPTPDPPTEDSSLCHKSEPCPWNSEGWNTSIHGFSSEDLSLVQNHGELTTRLELHPHSTAVCLTLEYYIEPGSSATIDVLMVNNEEEIISLGTLTAWDKVHEWKRHRFIGEITAGYTSLKIVSHKTQREIVSIRSITNCNETETVNTTINRAGSTEIHARNNALGLPFLSQDGLLHCPNTEADVKACAALNCTWKATNFNLSSRLPLPWEPADYFIDTVSGSADVSSSYKPQDLLFVTPDATGTLYIYLSGQYDNNNIEEMYVIKFQHNDEGLQLLKCRYHTIYNGWYSYFPGMSHVSRSQCDYISNRPDIKLLSNVTYSINVRQENGKLEVVQNGGYREVLLSTENIAHISTFSLKAAISYMKGILVADNFRSWTPEQEMGSLVSPSFVPHLDKVCVAVTYRGTLKLNLLQSDEVVEFSSVRKTLVNSWSIEVFIADITDKSESPVSVQLVAEDKDLQVALITGCNGQELEGIHVLSSSSDKTHRIEYQAYDVDVNINAGYMNGSTVSCINGGIFDSERRGCVCPPGFSGDNCEVGCGPNKYGSDCRGRCSMTSRGCKGMTLCRPKLGCNCAPGLKGLLCDHPCDGGQYGAGCKQLCGKCKTGTCDSYTGKCKSDCEDGFYPPLCQDTYKYVSQVPELVSRDFYSVQIKFMTDEDYLVGAGSPRFYQIQMKDNNQTKDGDSWTELVPHLLPADKEIVSNITGLEPGTHYKVRVVLLHEDTNSYQGPNVPIALLDTKCTVPRVVKYQFYSSDITTREIRVSWNYTREHNTWCKATHYEVQMLKNWQWTQQYKGLAESYQFTELLPGEKYKIRVRVVMTNGSAPFSNVLSVTTLSEAPEEVSNLHLVTSKPRALEIKWDKPLFTGGNVHRYKVSYQCLKLLACSQHDCSYYAGETEVTTTSAALHKLLPYAHYAIEVSAMSVSWGPTSQLLAVTAMTEPEVSPEPSSTSSVTHRTNSSMEVQWEPPQNCSGLNGYLYGYRYQLLGHNVSLEGTTDLTKATFTDLTPHTQYTVKVIAVTSGGWNAQYPLLIPAKTRATVPIPVEKLTVYKRGRRMLGIRWAAPNETYGALKSFKISYKLEGQTLVSSVISPTSCIAWPLLYCHTIHSLQPDTAYTVQVQARNKEVNEDGESASVIAVTKESAPLAPSFIRVLTQTETNLTVQWGLPEMLNGQLRSFLVNVEETDSVNSTDCCQYFPLQEVAVRKEQADYHIQVSSLRPASTYTISIAAKTVSLGQAMTITAHTRPPVPSMSNMLTIPDGSENLSSEPTIVIRPSTENVELVKGYLLLVLPQSTTENTTSEIWDERLAQELAQHINSSYYIAAEFKGDLQETSEVVVGTGAEMTTGKWGQVQDPVLESGATYRFGLVLLLEYCGVFGVGYTETQPFVI